MCGVTSFGYNGLSLPEQPALHACVQQVTEWKTAVARAGEGRLYLFPVGNLDLAAGGVNDQP